MTRMETYRQGRKLYLGRIKTLRLSPYGRAYRVRQEQWNLVNIRKYFGPLPDVPTEFTASTDEAFNGTR